MGELSRRDFLKLTGVTLGALAFRLPKGSEGVPEQNKLFESGLGDYYDVWVEGKKFEDSLGVNPPLFNEVYETLDGVISGKIDSFDPSVSLLRDGWGTEENQAINEAENYASEIPVEIDSTKVKDTEEEVRSFLQRVAKTYPLHVLAQPQKVVIVPGGGGAGWDRMEFTTTHDPEQAAVTWIHEATHEFDGERWKKVKPFTNKRGFIEYIKTYYECINDILEYYLHLPESEAIRLLKNGDTTKIVISPTTAQNVHLFSIWGFDGEKLASTNLNKDLKQQLHQWLSEFEIKADIDVISNDADSLTVAWSTFLHRVGNRLRTMNIDQRERMLQKNPKVKDIINAAMYGLSLPDYNVFFEGCLGAIGHFLVGPVQARGGGLPDSPFEPEFSFLVNSDAKLQQVRLASFSRLPLFASYSQIRESFGLTSKRPETYDERLKRSLATALIIQGAILFTAAKFVEIVTRRSDYQKHVSEFADKVKGSMFRDNTPILIDSEGKVLTNVDGDYKLQLREVEKEDSFELDTFEPTVLVLTDDRGQDSIIIFPPLNRTAVFGYGKHYNNLGVLVTGPAFGIEDNALKVAHTPNFGYSDVRGPGIIPGKPYGIHWGKGLSFHFGGKIQNVKLPWNYKKGEEMNITDVKVGKLIRLP